MKEYQHGDNSNIPLAGAVLGRKPDGTLLVLPLDASGKLDVSGGGGGGGGAVTIADGANVVEGALADAAVVTDTSGSLSGKLRGLLVVLLRAFALGTPIRVDPVGSTAQPVTGTVTVSGAVTSSGTATVVGGLTHNNLAPAANNIGVLPAIANASPPTFTEGDQVLESVDLHGRVRTKEIGSAFTTGQISIDTTVGGKLIIAANANRMRLLLQMTGTTQDVYIGPSGVTTSTGALFSAIKGNQFLLRTSAAVYGIVASGTQTISYIEETS